MAEGKLFIIPTPVGNLADITFRAVETLKKVDLIACEDTRTSGILLKNFDIKKKLLAYHKFSEKKQTQELIHLLQNGQSVALISDAGTPGISDPAEILISEAIKNLIDVECLPGATAFVPALIDSGMTADKFIFIGFLPEKEKSCEQLFTQVSSLPFTLIFYEAPHRLFKTLEYLRLKLGNRKAAIIREISKIYETKYRNTLSYFLENREEIVLKGEFVVVVEGAIPDEMSDEAILKMAEELSQQGIKGKSAVKEISEKTGLPKNRVYGLLIKID